MPNFHRCTLPQRDTSGLRKLPPNASFCKRFGRKIKKQIILNPENFRCMSFFRNKSAIMTERRRHIESPYSYIIHPFSNLSVFLEVSFFFVWLLKMIFDPMTENIIYNPDLRLVNSYVLLPIQKILIALFFLVGYVDDNTGEVIIETKKVISKYLRTFFFFDMLASEVFDLVVFVIAMKTIGNVDLPYNVLKLVDFAHIPCLYVRLNTILDFLDDIGRIMRIKRNVRRCIVHALKTYMYLHVFSCTLYLVPQVVYHKKWPSSSWLVYAHIAPVQKPTFHSIYGECFLMTLCYFFGASSGKYIIEQTNEQICLTAITIFGRIYTLYLVADILRMFGIVGLSQSNYERQLASLKEYTVGLNLPTALRSRMIKYYNCKLQKRYFNEKEILGSLSHHLRTEIFLFSARTLMQKSNVLKYLPENDVATLISLMRLVTFASGDIIFSAGEQHDDIYFISSGTISIISSDGVELCHLEDGEVFGTCQMILGDYKYSAVVVETSDLFLIGINEFFKFLDDYPSAILFLQREAEKRIAFYKQMEDNAKRKVDKCLEELKKGRLLEKKRARHTWTGMP